MPSFVELALWFLRRFLKIVNVFLPYSILLSPLRKEHGPSFEQKWIPITQGCFVPIKFVKIGPVVLRRRFLKIVNVFSPYSYYLPLEKGLALHLKKSESASLKDALNQVRLKFALWFLRKKLLKFVNVISLFLYYIPLDKGVALFWNKLESPIPKDALYQVCWNWPSGSWEEDENVKSLQTDGRQTTGDQKSSLELSAQWAKTHGW